MSRPEDMLFGRRTWTDFTTHMNAATTTLRDASAWQNSVLLRGEATGTVAELKGRPGWDLSVIGSASLVRGLGVLIAHYDRRE